MNKIGGLTIALNEEVLIAFSVGSVLPYVDKYVVVDTGSEDHTVEILRKAYRKEIDNGKLHIIEFGRLKDWDISAARNQAIEWLKEKNIDYIIRADADEVYYDTGAIEVCTKARTLDKSIARVSYRHNELYQYEIETNKEWLGHMKDILIHNKSISCKFFDRPLEEFRHDFIMRCDDAYAKGRWVDEAWTGGKFAENIFNTSAGSVMIQPEIVVAHYGWARPVQHKRWKEDVWRKGEKGKNKRVETLHQDPEYTLVDYAGHPEVFSNGDLWPDLLETVIQIAEDRG